ncbi:MAG: DUF1579 domain-containing protein [Chlorobi bacterium]|nr:DUF1579 domain-containing protein [Chlorobiota bacterium]
MKTIKIASILLLLFSFSLMAQEEQHQMSPEQKAWMEYMTPGEEQLELAKTVGDWTYESKFWMSPDQKEPMVTNGTAKFESILGGRYISSEMKGMMMNSTFEGRGLDGFDNARKIYVSTWVDNMGTGIMYMEGTKEDGKLVYNGTSVNPVTKASEKMKTVITTIDDDHFKMEMFMVTDNGDFKSMEINYTRVK